MPRPRTFDEEAVVDRAIELFRARGYEAVGVQELVDALGISRSSLYAAFGSKHDLYVRALDRYRSSTGAAMFVTLGDATRDPIDRIRAVIDQLAAAVSPDDTAGCLVVNAACERGTDDEAVTGLVTDQLDRMESAFADALHVARSSGRLERDADPAVLARFLVTVIQGARVLDRVGDGRRPAAAYAVAHQVLDTVEVPRTA